MSDLIKDPKLILAMQELGRGLKRRIQTILLTQYNFQKI